ncbi:MAG: MarR family transcriptional regulator [Bacteroidia bacterium]|nr:MarR family transcriptional regulator [Bacteroidia bacterium]
MKIEEEIHSSFASNRQKIGINLIYTGNWYLYHSTTFFKRFHLTGQQYNILRILRGAESKVSVKYIKERMLDRVSDVSRVVEKLRLRGLITRSECNIDRRLVDISITLKGIKLLETIDPELSCLDSFFTHFTEEELIEFNRLMDKLRERNK